MRPFARPFNWTWCLAGLVGIYAVVAWIACVALGRPGLFQPTMYFKGYFITYLVVVLPYLIGGVWSYYGGRRIFSHIRLPQHDLPERWRRIVMALPLLVAMPLFMVAFTAMKNLISLTIPFTWDPYFAELDKAIHFNRHPWQLIEITNWHLTQTIDMAYTLWVGMLAFMHVFMALRAPEDPVRNKFFLVYIVAFILLGNVTAAAFMSGGPFFPWLDGEPAPAYAPLMAYLSQDGSVALLNATRYQEYLLQAQAQGSAQFGSGISAFPSMHIAITTLYLLAAWGHRTWRLFALAFLALMFVGSVHLAWHYAIDGYISFLGTILLWVAAARIVQPAGARGNASAADLKMGS